MKKHVSYSYIVYEGASMIDSTRKIFAVVTNIMTPSTNSKTGPMMQLWILPETGTKIEDTKSVCGECPAERWCYVDRGRMKGIVNAYNRGSYAGIQQTAAKNVMLHGLHRTLRLGAFGNLSALPIHVVESFIDLLRKHKIKWTGYEQHWMTADPKLKQVVMASVSTVPDAIRAHKQGWRFFLASLDAKEDLKLLRSAGVYAKQCPNDLNKQVQCAQCLLCDGLESSAAAASIVNSIHGPDNKIKAAKLDINNRLKVL